MTIVATIITYNRLSLLQECIAAVKKQSRPVDRIIVINNASTDGTTEWLAEQSGLTVICQENKGGTWGFNTGLKNAYEAGADWVWVMDDDTIPYEDTLEKLVKAIEMNNDPMPGFYGSKVVWKDGSEHLMNIQEIDYSDADKLQHMQLNHMKPVRYNSFVSILVSRNAVEKAGLPIKEFFIWCDDIEFTRRIIDAGYSGTLVENSLVLHKTPENYKVDIFIDKPANIWKYKYGLRNELYIRKHHKSNSSFWRNILKRLFVWPFLILFRRKNARWTFIKTVWRSTISAVSFNPTIEHI
ncbi:MAG: glycosyltransferase family 2 protein [Filimonas sp.]|nr:glycosyltransferase family 2 protein [Filimonas sp.]